MALKLGELVAYLRTDNSRFQGGLAEAERDFGQTGRNLERESDRIGGSTGDKTAGGFLARFRGGLAGLPGTVSGGFTSMPPMVQGPVLAAAAVVGAVFVAGLGAAILLGLGGGVLAAGVMLAAKDPAVAAAWKEFGDRAKGALTGFTDAFKGPVMRAAGTFGDAIERMEPAFTRIGETMAPIIDKLAPALTDMAEKAMPGIEKAIKASAPLFDKLAEHMPKIGEAVSSFFDSIADSGPGAMIFLDLILTTFEGLIRFWGNGIEFWSNTLEVLNTFFTEKVPEAWNWLVDKLKAGVDKIGGFFSGVKDWIVARWNELVDFVKGLPGRISQAGQGMFDSAKNAAGAAKDWVVDRFNSLVSFVRGLPGRIGDAAGGMWDGLKSSFRSAINWIVGKWNGLSFGISGGTFLGISYPSMSLGTPDIPYLAQGGIVPATPGGRLAVIGEGREDEAVAPLSKLRGMVTDAVTAALNGGDRGGVNVEKVEVNAYSDRFSLGQVLDELAMHGTH